MEKTKFSWGVGLVIFVVLLSLGIMPLGIVFFKSKKPVYSPPLKADIKSLDYLTKSWNSFSSWGSLTGGLFLLFLAVGGNFIAETFGCHLQQILTHQPGVKFLFLFMITFFATAFQSQPTEPIYAQFFKAFVVFILFVVISKTTKWFMFGAVMILIGIFICQLQKRVYIARFEEDPDNETNKDKLNSALKWINIFQSLLLGGLILILMLGVRNYIKKQVLDRGSLEGEINPWLYGLDSVEKEKAAKNLHERQWLWAPTPFDITNRVKGAYNHPPGNIEKRLKKKIANETRPPWTQIKIAKEKNAFNLKKFWGWTTEPSLECESLTESTKKCKENYCNYPRSADHPSTKYCYSGSPVNKQPDNMDDCDSDEVWDKNKEQCRPEKDTKEKKMGFIFSYCSHSAD